MLFAVSLFLTAIQIPALAVQALSYTPYERSLTITTDGMFDLSGGRNTILIVLDTMDEQYYADYVKDHPEFTEVLTGFTHYENTLASGSRTIVAMPSMLTGVPFKRENTYTEYLQEIYGSENPLQKIHDTGASVGIYSDNLYFSDNALAFADNFTKDPIRVGSWKILTKKLYKMTFSRFFPHLLKKYVWFGTSEFKQAMDDYNAFSQNDARFIRQYRKNGFTFREDTDGAFRLYHLYGAHPPFNLDAEGNSSEESDLAQQNAGCFGMVREMIGQLQQSGHYDDATIIVTADHGDLDMGIRPFFLLKLPGDTDPYRTSSAPLSLFDLPGILCESFGLAPTLTEYGCSLEEVQTLDTRERHFFLNTTGSSQIRIVEYKTTGHAGDKDLLEEVQTYEEEGGKDVPYQLGTVLTFDKDATGNKYATEGFAINSGFRTILRGPVARLEIPLEDPPEKGVQQEKHEEHEQVRRWWISLSLPPRQFHIYL